MSNDSVGRSVKETCNVLWKRFSEGGFIKQPDSIAEWRNIAREYEKHWNFPNCVGAIDGKHVTIHCPARGGSMYFKYKKFHSIVLPAVVNARYEFLIVDMGTAEDLVIIVRMQIIILEEQYIKVCYSFPHQENWFITFPKNILMFSLGMKLSHYVVIF